MVKHSSQDLIMSSNKKMDSICYQKPNKQFNTEHGPDCRCF